MYSLFMLTRENNPLLLSWATSWKTVPQLPSRPRLREHPKKRNKRRGRRNYLGQKNTNPKPSHRPAPSRRRHRAPHLRRPPRPPRSRRRRRPKIRPDLMSGGSGSSGRAAPRYAPDDPTLPKPWRGLVDGTTGYLYYWNPETNVTQYERPMPPDSQLPPPPPPLPPPPPRSRDRRDRSRSRSRSRTPPRRDHRDRERERDRDRRHDDHASSKSASSHHHPAPAAVADDPSTEAYRRRHEISVTVWILRGHISCYNVRCSSSSYHVI